MIVAVRSEMDSRPFLYSMLRVLSTIGKVCLVSSNPIINRLIDDESDSGFRNITVYVDSDGAVDSVYEDYGIKVEDFDFIILDNMGAIEYDVLIVPIGEVVTDNFQEEIDLLKTDVNVRFVQYGKPQKKQATKETKTSKSRLNRNKDKGNKEPVESDEADDPTSKFRTEIDIDEEYNVSERFYNCTFPTWQDIENLESRHQFFKLDQKVIDAIYDIFKRQLNVDKRQFDKTFKREDSKLTGAVKRSVADIDSNPKKRR